MTIKINDIHIHAFRGIPDYTLPLEGKNLLLKGDNGTGKSSFIDAFEFFFTGTIKHLEGTQGLSLKRHAANIKFEPSELCVALTMNPGQITLKRTLTDEPLPSQAMMSYFNNANKGTFILRRAQMLEFIEAKPRDRFSALSNIMGLAHLDEIELNLMKIRDAAKAELNSSNQQKNELYCELSKALNFKVTGLDDALTTLNDLLKSKCLPKLDSLNDIMNYCEKTLQSSKLHGTAEKAQPIERMMNLADKDPFSEDLGERIKAFNDDFNSFRKERLYDKMEYMELLSTGKKIIIDEKRNACPLCGQQMDIHLVLDAIEKRLETLAGLSELASNLRKTLPRIIDTMSEIKSEIKALQTQLKNDADFASEKTRLDESLAKFESLMQSIKTVESFKNEIPYALYLSISLEINVIFRDVSLKCAKKIDELALSAKDTDVISVATTLVQIKNIVDGIIKNEKELLKRNTRHILTDGLFTIFSDIKKEEVQKAYDFIKNDIQQYYSMLHPNDICKNIDLSVEFGKRASTTIQIDVFGTDEDPRALSSEGHLDSLGLCIFLAFVNKFNADCSLLILDDVVTAIDCNHREKICDLLFSKFNDKQLVITTHDEIWYEQLRNYQRTYGIDGNFKNMIITNWDLINGPAIKPYRPRWEKIQEKINDGDKSVGNEGRQYLEWLLEKLCDVTKAPVPYNISKKYEVWELLPSVEKRLYALIQDEDYKSKVTSAFKELNKTLPMGNLLSHYSLLLDQVSLSEVKHFCESVHDLHNVFLCPSCETFIAYYPTPRELRCEYHRCTTPMKIKTN